MGKRGRGAQGRPAPRTECPRQRCPACAARPSSHAGSSAGLKSAPTHVNIVGISLLYVNGGQGNCKKRREVGGVYTRGSRRKGYSDAASKPVPLQEAKTCGSREFNALVWGGVEGWATLRRRRVGTSHASSGVATGQKTNCGEYDFSKLYRSETRCPAVSFRRRQRISQTR